MKLFQFLQDEKILIFFVFVGFVCAFEMGQGHISGIL